MTEEQTVGPIPRDPEYRDFIIHVTRIGDVRGVNRLLYSEAPAEAIYLSSAVEHGDGFNEDAARDNDIHFNGLAYVGYPARRIVQIVQDHMNAHGYGGTVESVEFTSGPHPG